MSVKHKKVSLVADGPDASMVRPSDWNAEHDFVRTSSAMSASGAVSPTAEFIKCTGGASGIQLDLPDAATVTDKEYTFKRVDSDVGEVVIAGTLGQTIDGVASYVLLNQWQYVTLQSDGSGWLVKGNN